MVAAVVLEVEVKLRITDPDAARRALLEAGATARPMRVEQDQFFQHPLRDFAATREALRLRRDDDKLELTYKGPPLQGMGGAVKAREEHNIPVGADPQAMLLALGFKLGPSLRKTREPYSLAGVAVTLDHLEGHGWFAEVEAMGVDAEEAKRAVEAVIAKLGWHALEREPRSYLEIALRA